jgi:GNAT superfamily N-acetyltransferase
MDPADILVLYDEKQRIEIEYPGMHKEAMPEIVRFTRAGSGLNFVLYSRLDGANVDRVIREQVAHFSVLDQPFEWKVFDHDTPPDLVERLVAQGFEAEVPEAVMVLDLECVPDSLLADVTADVRPVLDRAALQEVVAIEGDVWGGDFGWIVERLGDHLEIPGYLSVYVAYEGGRAAAAAWIYFHDNGLFADLWGGSTRAEYRKRGLYTALLATRVQEAIQRGYRFLTIDAGPMSRPIVARHGFRLLAHARACEWTETSARKG